jgi:hypothetical protein
MSRRLFAAARMRRANRTHARSAGIKYWMLRPDSAWMNRTFWRRLAITRAARTPGDVTPLVEPPTNAARYVPWRTARSFAHAVRRMRSGVV